MGALGFYFDMKSCIGCRTCQIACKDRNDLPLGVLFRWVKRFETGIFPNPNSYNVSYSCNHCENAKCATGCPTGAMHYGDDGTVQHDPDLCIGCQYCTMNCPYGVPRFLPEKNIIGKCDSCIDFRNAGQNPVCVDACLMRCLHFGDLDDLRKEHGEGLVNAIPILPSPQITNPSVLIRPKPCAFDPNFKEVEV